MATDPLYVTWEHESEKQNAYKATASNIDAYTGIQRSVAFRGTTYLDIESNRSVRPSFDRRDYDVFRPSEATPSYQKQIMRQCMMAYDRVGIVRNVIDLMSDFASQGIRIVHPNKNVEKFFRKWFNQIGGYDRSERFLNYLYRCGNVCVRRRNAKITQQKQNEIVKTAGADDIDVEIMIQNAKKNMIPWRYDFLNPLAVEIEDTGMGVLGKPTYILNLSKYTYNSIVKTSENNNVVFNNLPDDIRKMIAGGERRLPLDPESVMFYYYKKDDWLMFANPMIYAILDDIKMLEKMKLADLAALDGAISNVRLWTVGDLEHKIVPTKAAIDKLRDILASNVGGGTMDLVWGPELKFTESQSQVYKFLGAEKYQPVLTSIYAGLGIPPTLTGVSGSGGGYSNNYISLKTLIERLEYGREVLKQFWRQEIDRVRKAMGFRLPADIHFDQIILSDETTERQLLIQLADRDIISQETLVERFGEMPTIEKTRVKRETVDRRNDVMPDKASPYHKPQFRDDIAKIALQKDQVDDKFLTDMGIPVRERTAPEQGPPPSEKPINKSQKPVREAGRPDGASDTEPRKRRRVSPRSSDISSAVIWGIEAQNKISDIMNPFALEHFNKGDLRGLTKEETIQLDSIKHRIFANTIAFSEITEELVKNILDSGASFNKDYISCVDESTKAFVSHNGRKPISNEIKFIRSHALVETSNNW